MAPDSADVLFFLARCDARLVLWSRRAENCGGPTVAVPDRGSGDARGVSTGAVLGMFRHAQCGADTRGDSTGAVLGQGEHVRRCVTTGPGSWTSL